MSRMSLRNKIIFCLLLTSVVTFGQSANNTSGCAELKVEFTAPTAGSYFWVFGDGPASVSSLQNPVHSYIQEGDYIAQLFDVENGTQVGDDIMITVYPPIKFEIDADFKSGCAPLEVNFTSTIDIHPDIDVEDIVWTFGDGNSAVGQNVNYTYQEDGIFTVSVKVITSEEIKCDEPVIFPDYIKLEGVKTRFLTDKKSSCDVPADFIFTNITDAETGTTYFWDFGNGETSPENGPHTITYNSEGLFFPLLISTTVNGCVSSHKSTLSLGSPVVTPTFPDTVCVGAEVLLSQTTIANSYLWDFSGTAIDSTLSDLLPGLMSDLKRPMVTFTEPGLQTFTLTATANEGCESVVELEIFVYKPDASYGLVPNPTCTDPILIEYAANDLTQTSYFFNNNFLGGGVVVESDSPTGSTVYQAPERDEYYMNRQDSVSTRLIVSSAQGCRDTAYLNYYLQKPEAFFVPDIVKGCIPFTVNFADESFSDTEIQDRSWDFGDGNFGFFSTNDTLVSHTYTTTGNYDVVLFITDEEGCRDESRAVRIIAIDKISVPAIPSECPPDLTFCVDETIRVAVQANQVTTNVHIESDEGRFDHCWRDQLAEHAYQYPGVYPFDFTYEFLTIFIDSIVTGCFVTVEGARSEIEYSIDCGSPYVVNLSGENSINADEYTWYVEDEIISNEETLVHTFEERGEYTIYLDTQQDGVGCMHRDSVLVHITEIIADINIADKSCASSPTPLDASKSQDVHDKCRAGYIWQFENQRPREVDDAVINHILLPGFQSVTLIVEDINGCTDTISAPTTAYDLAADFTADTLICLPSDVAFTNLSTGDTTIVNYAWDFGAGTSAVENPIHTFDSLDYDSTLLGDSITVSLFVQDAIGCTDTSSFLIETYDIFSDLMLDKEPIICQNEMITFEADDYLLGGSFLTYAWDFGVNGSSTEDSPTVTFDEPGDHLVLLTFTEDISGCQGTLDTIISVLPTPVADFISDQDDVEFICFPEQLIFMNTSTVGANADYDWDFGNGAASEIQNPIIPFDKGTYEVVLIVSTEEGCSDTTSQTYTLVGPEGDFTVDKENICPGEEITLTLGTTVDVSTYTWDFGDGVQIDNESPVTHIYDPESSVGEFTPTLIIRADESGCELIQNIPINVSSITADFTFSTEMCPGEITLSSTFDNPQTIEWDIDGQIVTGNSNPSVVVSTDKDNIDITLNVTDANGCVVERMQNIPLADEILASDIKFPNVFSPNGDNVNPVFNIVYDENALDSDVEVIEFKVYNRWGELLYDNENPTRGWDGRYLGVIVPPDVYAYYIEVAIEGCASRSRKGNVTVIK